MLRSEENSEKDFRHELENLQLLHLLKHPSMVELIGAFILTNEYHLLFPQASQGSLHDVLEGEILPEELRDHDNVFAALCGLCSALAKVHNFFSDSADLRAIGCHHDLKPQNILVHNNSFLLADFGLSTLKIEGKDSGSSYKNVHGYYVAPECEPLDPRAPQTNGDVVRRSSDVWSLGCIITEVMVHLVFRRDGREEFKKDRYFTAYGMASWRYHKGPEKEQPKVEAWLKRLESELDLHGKDVIQVVRSMLQLDPHKRPKSPLVETRMQSIVLKAFCQSIMKAFATLWSKKQSTPLYVEQRRFLGWLWSWDNDRLVASDFKTASSDAPFYYDRVLPTLRNLKFALIAGQDESLLRAIKMYNDQLLDHLSKNARAGARSYLVTSLLSEKDITILNQITRYDSRIQSMADIRKAFAPSSKESDRKLSKAESLSIDSEHIEDRGSNMGWLKNLEGIGGFDVIIETRRYESKKVSENDMQELKDRLSDVAVKLYEINKALRPPINSGPLVSEKLPVLPVLECCGYFFKDNERGLVYKFPREPSNGKPLQAATLFSIIKDFHKNHKNHKISHASGCVATLSDRMSLARALAESILRFHQADWLQRSISSHNIMFFFENSQTWLTDENTQRPYFLGYVNSRQDSLDAFTEGPTGRSATEINYQHPGYLKGGVRFSHEHDYYSLGVVLLEIALWKPLDAMKGFMPDKNDAEPMRENLLTKYLPELGFLVGPIYREVVESVWEVISSWIGLGNPTPVASRISSSASTDLWCRASSDAWCKISHLAAANPKKTAEG